MQNDRFKISEVTIQKLHSNLFLLYSGQSGNFSILTKQEKKLLLFCRRFDFIPNHAEAFYKQHTGEIENGIAMKLAAGLNLFLNRKARFMEKRISRLSRQLEWFVEKGLLVSETE